jgi:hypothetical protein
MRRFQFQKRNGHLDPEVVSKIRCGSWDQKKKLEKKSHKNYPQKKVRALPGAKKKVGVEQEKAAQVILDSA